MQSYEMNKAAWDRAVSDGGNPYTTVVSPEEVAVARQGRWSLYLSDRRPVPREWFGSLEGRKVLCLASAGGQQAPILAALGGMCQVPWLFRKSRESKQKSAKFVILIVLEKLLFVFLEVLYDYSFRSAWMRGDQHKSG